MRPVNFKKFIAISAISFAVIVLTATFFFEFTSTLSTIYLVRDKEGSYHMKTDLILDDAAEMIFMIDMNGIIKHMDRSTAYARQKPVLELSWNKDEGDGNIKEFRPDGTAISISFSRYRESDGSKPHGLFVGGDLPFGDAFRSQRMNTSGFGYYDGKDWYHIWCAANEGFSFSGSGKTVNPAEWEYKGSKIIKQNQDEVVIETYHQVAVDGVPIKMTRRASFSAGRDYFILGVTYKNAGDRAVSYAYSYGDEPWVGSFGAARGDVGWYEGGIVMNETAISPQRFRYAGYWDLGNKLALEKQDFTGYANFIEWDHKSTPSYVYFSNSFENCCDNARPLDDENSRVLELLWLNQPLAPGQSRTYSMAIGMARMDERRGFPVKPEGIF